MALKVLQLATTYQSLITILDGKLGLLASTPGIELHVASSFEDHKEIRKTAGNFFAIPMVRVISPLFDIVSIVKLYTHIKKNKFDIIHTHTAKAGIIGAMAGRLAGVPVVHSYHGLPFFIGQDIGHYFFIKLGEKALSLLRNVLFSQNRADIETLKKSGTINKRPILFEGNGVDPDTVCAQASRYMDKVQDLFSENNYHLLCISRLESVKTLYKIFDIASFLKSNKVPFECIIAGKGHLQYTLERELCKRGLKNQVKIVYTSYIHSLISKADLVVLSSKKEGLPRSIMEAMALGKPIVATDVPGTNEIVINGKTGILVPYNNQKAFNEATHRLLIDKALGTTFGEEGRKRVLSQYSGEKDTVALWVKTYHEIIDRVHSTQGTVAEKRVLFVSTLGYTMEAFLIPYMDIFIRRDFEVVALSNWKHRWNILPQTIKTEDYPFSRKSLSLGNIIAFLKLLRYLQREKFQYIYTHTPIASAIVRLAKRITGNKALVIYEIHGLHIHEKGIPLLNSVFKWVECSLAGFTDKIITINRDDFSFAKLNFTKSRIYYSPGIGVDLSHYNLNKVDTRSIKLKYGIQGNVPVIVTIADFIKRKRIDLCLNVAKILKNDGIAFKWLILGDGLLRHTIAAMIFEDDLQDFVVLTGQQKDVRPFLAASDIFVLLSIQEGLPRSLLEAGAMGLPAVVSDIRGSRDLVENGVNSYLSPARDAGAAAQYIKLLLADKTMQIDFGTKLKTKIAEEFSIENTVAIHEAIFFDTKPNPISSNGKEQ